MSDIKERIKEALFHKTEAEKRLAVEALIQEQVRLARKKTLTDITIWANQEMANDHVQELKGDK